MSFPYIAYSVLDDRVILVNVVLLSCIVETVESAFSVDDSQEWRCLIYVYDYNVSEIRRVPNFS